MKTYLIVIAVSVCAVALGYGAVYILEADEVRTLEDLYEIALTHPDLALDKVPQIIKTNPELTSRCHEITHGIGHRAYASMGDKAFEFMTPMCGAGYLHGLLEEAVTIGSIESLVGRVHELCTDNQLESCLHGLGHAIFNATQDTRVAVGLCKQITDSQTDCYDGVFMEQFDSESSLSKLSYEEGYNLCMTIDSVFQPSCFFYLPRTSKDLPSPKVVAQCESLLSPANLICAQGSGVMFMKYEATFDKDIATGLCRGYEKQDSQQHCINGVEKYSEFGSLENSRWQ